MSETLPSEVRTEAPDEGAATPVARHPQQQRGQLRVEQLLDAAEALVVELGLEGVTTNAVAERAGSSMGSLYHFFPGGKDAVILGLGRRYMEQMSAVNAKALDVEMAHVPLRDLFRGIVMGMADFIAATPAFPAVHETMIREHCLPNGKLAEYEDAIQNQVRRYIEVRLPRLPKARLEIVTKVSFQTVNGSVDLSMRVNGEERQVVLDELQDVMVRYFEPLEREFGPIEG